jgi:hypothetical protein
MLHHHCRCNLPVHHNFCELELSPFVGVTFCGLKSGSHYSEICLKLNLLGTNFFVQNRQVFDLYRLNLKRFPTMGRYLKFV